MPKIIVIKNDNANNNEIARGQKRELRFLVQSVLDTLKDYYWKI